MASRQRFSGFAVASVAYSHAIPPLRLPSPAARLLAAAGRAWPLTPLEVRAASQRWTYRSTKAKRELSWSARPHEETLEATVDWYLDREHDQIMSVDTAQRAQYRVAGAALGLGESAVGAAARVVRGIAAGR